MGLFGGKKVYVSSSIYNLAGEENERPNFLKTSLFAAVMNPYENYIGETIVGNYLEGPGIMQRSFFNWAVRNDIAGLPTLRVSTAAPIDRALMALHIPIPGSPAGLVNRVQSAELTDGDFSYWAEKYIIENEPNLVNTDWVSDYDSATHTITIQYESGSTVTIPAENYSANKKYAIAKYLQVIPSSVEPLVVGAKTFGAVTAPSTIGYTLESTVNTGNVNHTLNQTKRVTRVYSSGAPTTVETTFETNVVGFNTILRTWKRIQYVGQTTTALDTSTLEKWLYIWERRGVYVDNSTGQSTTVVNDLGGGNTETVTTRYTGDLLRPVYDRQEDTQETVLDKVSGNIGIFIYEMGTGIADLDALNTTTVSESAPGYYPMIPIRLDNVSIKEPQFADLYKESKLAYRRATGGPLKGGKFLPLIEEIEANPDIGDIDYAYVQWGVSVNVLDESCRKYLYTWFKDMIAYQNSTAATVTNFANAIATYKAQTATMNTWVSAQTNPNHVLYGTPKPTEPVLVEPSSTTVRLVTDHSQITSFDNRFTWVNISESNHVGSTEGKEIGEYWFVEGVPITWDVHSGTVTRTGFNGGSSFDSRVTTPRTIDRMEMRYKTGANTYSKLTIVGMVHENYIYGGKSVRTTLKEGVADNAESIFIVPLHAPSVKALGVKGFTQMSMSNTFIVFNSYLIVKKKWYQTFLGMLLIVIAIAVVSALIAPQAVGAASGAFGTNAAVGTSLGLSGTSAIVAGAVTNAIAAVVISQAIGLVSVKIFGEKWGALISTIVGFAVNFGISGGFENFTMSTAMSPRFLLGFSSAIANGYKGFVNAEIGEINEQMQENQDAYEKSKRDLELLMRSMGLTNDLFFDPLSLTDTVKGNKNNQTQGSYVPESLDQFLSRTQMTGSDIVDITLSMVSDYRDLQMTLPKS